MRQWGARGRIAVFGATLLLTGPALTNSSLAAPGNRPPQPSPSPVPSRAVDPTTGRIANTVHYRGVTRGAEARSTRRVTAYARWISCVPYAREVSGIMVVGNAYQWWENAAGQYARGDRPEIGAVLNFRSNRRMPLGHVAIVDKVINSREIVIEHANWPGGALRGPVMRNITVVDVSEANNWSAVRVELGHTGEFGSVYPTYGFIYNRPDPGVVTASITRPAPQPDINPVPSDLRPRAEQSWHMVEEVAEAPPKTQRIDTRAGR